MNIAGLAIKRPVFVVMIVLSILTLGLVGYSRLPVDLLPNIDFPNIFVVTQYPGASSDEIEQLITKPMENALAGVEDLDTLASISREGMSLVIVTFTSSADIKYAELTVREKVGQAMSTLTPAVLSSISQPVIGRASTEDMPIIYMALKGNRDLADLREIFEDIAQPRIQAVDGVGQVTVIGARLKVINLTVDKTLLAANGLTYNQVVNALSLRNVSFPSGQIYESEKWINVRVLGLAENYKDFGDISLTTSTGRILRIKDIAKVEVKLEDEATRAKVNKENACMVVIYKQSGGNTVGVSENLKNALPDIQKVLPKGVSLKMVSDSSKFIKRSVNGVQQDILFGAFLAIVIVWLFLGNFRSTIITAIALPNSLLGAFFLVYIAGFTINTMTLLSLSLAVGLLIDDSIVVRENIFRHIEEGEEPKVAAEKGTNEVALAVISTTLSILAVFIPISFLSGVVGQFFREFGLTVAFALMVSLVDAFTSAPMLSAYWYKKSDPKNARGISRFFNNLSSGWNKFYDWLNSLYKDILNWSLRHKAPVLIGVILLFAFSIYVSRFIGQNFMSSTDSGSFNINLETYPGAPLDKIDYYISDVENFLSRQKDVETYYSQVGAQGQSQIASVYVDMKDLKQRKLSTEGLISIVRKYIRGKYDRDIKYRLTQSAFYGGTGGGLGGGGGGNSPIYLNIAGPDLSVLAGLSQTIYRIAQQTPGAVDLASTYKPGAPEFVVKVDNMKAEQMGISAQTLGLTLRDLIAGNIISEFTLGDRNYDVIIRMDENDRKTIDDIRSIQLTTRTGQKVPLSAIANFTYSSAPLSINRENKQRIVRIVGNIEPGHSLSEVIANLTKSIDKSVPFPPGYSYYFAGQQKQFKDLAVQMVLAMGLALLFMYMILASLYNNFLQPLILMLSIPLAIIGAFLALIITGTDLDIYGYIGLLMVFGLVAKNAILLIDFTNKKREEGMSIREALLHSGPLRLRPILMTSFAIIFGMLPMALGLNEGSRGRQALPITVIGGILTSTFLTLVVVPVVYEWVEKALENRKLRKLENKESHQTI